MTPDKIKRAQATLCWNNHELAKRMRVCLSTVEKWRSGSVQMRGPESALLAIFLRDHQPKTKAPRVKN